MQKENILILLDIRSAYNVGSLFRTADALGLTKIVCVGYTPTPVDSFGRIHKEIEKTALGATTPWEYRKHIRTLLAQYKKQGYILYAIEQDARSIDYKKIKPTHKNVFILGNEVNGVPSRVLALCDYIAEIPMYGKKESLNVSVAAGIALARILNR